MKITVNGKELNINIMSNALTVAYLLEHLKINSSRVVVEKNGVIANRNNYGTEAVIDGDIIEIVQFVGGG